MRILEKIATLEEPRAGHIAKVLRRDLRRVKTHLHVLETLFAIHALEPHPSGTGKTLYFICDVGLARILGASFERRIHTWALHEQLSQRAYRDDREHRLSFYRTSKGRFIHLFIEGSGGACATQILSEEKVRLRDLEVLQAFRTKNSGTSMRLYALGAQKIHFPKEKIEVAAWEAMA